MSSNTLLGRIGRILRKPLTLGVLAAGLLGGAAEAANIDMWVNVRGQWALIVPGSNLGGRVVYRSEYGCLITDRAIRGELLYVYASVSTWPEWCNPYITTARLRSTAGVRSIDGLNSMPQGAFLTVPTSPQWDNNHVQVCTASGWFEKRIPVGGSR